MLTMSSMRASLIRFPIVFVALATALFAVPYAASFTKLKPAIINDTNRSMLPPAPGFMVAEAPAAAGPNVPHFPNSVQRFAKKKKSKSSPSRSPSPLPSRSPSPSPSPVVMHYEGQVANDALHFSRYKFGPEISAKGPNAVVFYKGFIFVTHYSGDMKQRHVRLSRKQMGNDSAPWITVVFPHRHVLFRKDTALPEHDRRGDSHNTISLGISPEDSRLHLLFDMHAYTPSDFPNDYFNYQVSVQGAALVPDSEFTLGLFNPKQLYLSNRVSQSEYYRVSYPTFILSANNKLLVTWRIGGSLNASMRISTYENGQWGSPKRWNANSDVTGIYGQFKSFNGRLVMAWQRRHKSDAAEGYGLNRGLYVSTAENAEGDGMWQTVSGKAFALPFRDLDVFKVGEPCQPGERMVNAGGAMLSYVLARNGAIHMHARVDGAERHCFHTKPSDSLICSSDGVVWKSLSMHVIGDSVYRVGLLENEPILQSTKAGTDSWKTVYHASNSRKYSHGVSTMADKGTILFYAMELMGTGVEARPIHVLRLDISH